MQAGEGRSMVLELLPSTAGPRRDRSQGGAAWTGVAEDPMNLEPVSRPLAVRGRAALVVLVATLLAAGCGKGVVRPIPLPPLSRVVIAQGGDTTVQLNGVFFNPDGRHGWAVGNGGEIRATADAGASWARQVSHTLFSLNAVWFTDADSGWAVGNSGMAVHTTDGGATWTPMPTGASENLMDVFFAYPDTGWAVGGSGAVLRTFDWGATWTKQNPTAFTLHSVSFAGTRLGWAVGDNGTILGTTDRGLNWTLESPVTSQSLRGVWRRSELVAFAAGQQGVVPRTQNVGGTPVWELQNTGASNALE